MTFRATACSLGLTIATVASALSSPALGLAQSAVPPRALRSAGVTEHVGVALPTGLTFKDSSGRAVQLDALVKGPVPVLLVLAYARCAMLCSWILRGVADGIAGLEEREGLEVGRDFRFVVVSIDERETRAEAEKKRDALLTTLGHPRDASRLSYLFAGGDSTKQLADALGFAYAWDPASQQYAHPSVAFVLGPEARIRHYLYGVEFPAPILGAALTSARRGTQGRLDGVGLGATLLRCFRLDPAARRYGPEIQAYFRIGSLLLLGAVIALWIGLRRREKRGRAP